MTLHRIKEAPRREWTTTSVAEVMLPLDDALFGAVDFVCCKISEGKFLRGFGWKKNADLHKMSWLGHFEHRWLV